MWNQEQEERQLIWLFGCVAQRYAAGVLQSRVVYVVRGATPVLGVGQEPEASGLTFQKEVGMGTHVQPKHLVSGTTDLAVAAGACL